MAAGVWRCSAGGRRLLPQLLQQMQLQRRGAALRFNRRCIWLVSASLLLSALLLVLWQRRLPPVQDSTAFEVLTTEGMQWLRVSRDARRYVRPEQQTALLSPPPCAPRPQNPNAPTPTPTLRLLMLVASAPAHHERRQAIRETWGGRSEDARLVFVLGRGPEPATLPSAEVLAEAQQHGDLLVEDFTDAYGNLTLKTLFLLKWVVRECPAAAFVLKTDDDMLVNTRGLVRALPRWVAQARGRGGGADVIHEEAPPLIFGALHRGGLPIRDFAMKWYLPRWQFPDAVLPNFVSGGAYVITRAALELLFREAMDTPLLALEDVFLTGVVATRLDIARIHADRFWLNDSVVKRQWLEHACLYHHLLTMHGFSPSKLRQLWKPLVQLQPERQCNSLLMNYLGWLYSPGIYQNSRRRAQKMKLHLCPEAKQGAISAFAQWIRETGQKT